MIHTNCYSVWSKSFYKHIM